MGLGRLWEAVCNTVKGKADEAAEKLEDPVRDSKIAIEQANKELSQFKSDIASVMSEKKSLERELEDNKANIKKYNAVAEKALEAGNEDDARKALGLVESSEARVKELSAQCKVFEGQIKKLRASMEKRRAMVDNAERNVTVLKARDRCTKIRQAVVDAESKMNKSNPFTKLEKFEEDIQRSEDQIAAMEELTDSEDDDLESKYEVDTSVDDKLAKLKAKMAK